MNAERVDGKVATCWRGGERTSLAVEAWVGSSAKLSDDWRRAGPPARLAPCLGRTHSGLSGPRGAVLRSAV